MRAEMFRYYDEIISALINLCFTSSILLPSGNRFTECAKGFSVSAFKVTSDADLCRLPGLIEQGAEPVLVEVLTDPGDVGRIVR